MATIKSYTDIEQSKKLAKFLPLESADMIIVSIGNREGVETISMPKETFNILRTPFTDVRNTISCWSLSALLGVLKYPSLTQDVENKWFITDWTGAYPKSEHGFDNSIDACVVMIEKLHELNLL